MLKINTLYFRYAIEVEKTRSISSAAENLFMAQPNLSKAIHEIEDTLGFKVFQRTSKGVIPTEQGREFLVIARNIVSQLEKLDTIGESYENENKVFKICIPRASYISDGFIRFYSSLENNMNIRVNVMETNSMQTISGINSGMYSLGIIRYRPEQEKYFLDYLNEKKLSHKLIWEYDYLLMFSKEHKLAQSPSINESMLNGLPKVIHSDNSIPYNSLYKTSSRKTGSNTISLYDRANQFEILSRIPDTYLWVSPVSQQMLDRYNLVLRRCTDSTRRFKDVLIYPENYQFTPIDRLFIDKVYEAKNLVALNEYK